MKILFNSYKFWPTVGGIQQMSQLLAGKMQEAGHEVTLVTQTPPEGEDDFPYPVIRQPSKVQWRQLEDEHDLIFHNNISLRAVPRLFGKRKPWVVAHRTWIGEPGKPMTRQDRLKRFLTRFATKNIANSRAVADHLPVECVVIENCYSETFRTLPDVARDRDIVFVGRLVSDKGVDLLVEALGRLKGEGLRPSVTIVGSGPEEEPLREQVARLGLEAQVEFAGRKTGDDLVRLLNRHAIMAVPSRWQEPFGIVALEGAACGCVVVGSEGGGLVDAIGPCGPTFPNGDLNALTDRLRDLLTQPELMEKYRAAIPAHLDEHSIANVSRRYIEVVESAARSK